MTLDTTDTAQQLTLDERVRNLVLAMAPLSLREENEDPHLTADLGYDSLGLLELAFALETDFQLPAVAEQEAMGVQTLSDVQRLVTELLEDTWVGQA